MVYIKQERNS